LCNSIPEQFGASFAADGVRLLEWIESSDPLVDNFPHRLSPVNRKWKDGVSVYREFMNSRQSFKNFMHSENIAKFWPPGIKKITKIFVSSRWVVDDLLMGQGTAKYSQIYTLHQCIHNPLLNGYIPWALGSDYDAIEIVKMTLTTVPEKDWNMADMKVHLVAIAVMSGNYQLAERILSSHAEIVDTGKKWNELVLRIYLLVLVNDEDKVAQISKEYLATNANPDKSKNKITDVLDWSKKAIGSGQVNLWKQ